MASGSTPRQICILRFDIVEFANAWRFSGEEVRSDNIAGCHFLHELPAKAGEGCAHLRCVHCFLFSVRVLHWSSKTERPLAFVSCISGFCAKKTKGSCGQPWPIAASYMSNARVIIKRRFFMNRFLSFFDNAGVLKQLGALRVVLVCRHSGLKYVYAVPHCEWSVPCCATIHSLA